MDTSLKQEAAARAQQHGPGEKHAASEKIRRSPVFAGGRRFLLPTEARPMLWNVKFLIIIDILYQLEYNIVR